IANIGSWDWNIVTSELSWSDEIYRIFGLKPQEFGATYEAFLSYIHPDDSELVTKAVDTAIKEKIPYSIEHRLVRPDGSIRIVHERGETSYGPDGTPVRMVGTVQDITERKQTEDQLTLASQVFENALEGVIITDTTGMVQFANPAVLTITGYTPEEVIGQNPRIFRSDRHPREFYEKMWKSIATEGGWQGIIWNRRKDGEAFPEWLSITAVKDYTGKAMRYVSVFYDMSLIKQSEDTLRRQAYEDALTKLPNRLLFEDRLATSIASAGKAGGKVGVALIGLDRLKNINETLGFPAGDQLIQKAAERLRPLVNDGDTLARFGGDEFVCVLNDLKDEQDMVKMMLSMLEGLSLPFSIDGRELFITASAGAAFYPSDSSDSATLVQDALVAMRRAKNQDRNSYQLYTTAMNTRSYERLSLENDLRRAIGREEFAVYYQPKLSIKTGAIVGMEALVRWIHPVHGMVSPVKFIPLAEETGLIAPIGEFVMTEALTQLKKWVAHGYGDISVAVNLSAAQFRDKGLLKTIGNTLDHVGIAPLRLDIEITESMVMGDVNAAITTLKNLRDMGVRISMDDFGTGYSSLSYLKRFPIHCLKVDRSFIRDIPANADDVAITSAIISMAHSLNLTVVAEGVETMEQLEFLRANACDELQGYLFSPPVPAPEMGKMLASGKSLYALK
ncbi:MAG: EAL domain-containing protein, partial [Nitrospinae bacterium]|nr:EAL domain-containing protein [Nitrospinota bacterium]